MTWKIQKWFGIGLLALFAFAVIYDLNKNANKDRAIEDARLKAKIDRMCRDLTNDECIRALRKMRDDTEDIGYRGEPHRVCRRPQLLRGWGYDEQDDEQVLA